METEIYCRVRMLNKPQFDLAVQLVSAASESPLYVSEVDKALRNSFNALEFIPMTEKLTVDSDDLSMTLYWFLANVQEGLDAVDMLIDAGVSSLCTMIFTDGDFSAAYVKDKEGLRKLKTWNGKQLSRLPAKTDIPTLISEIEKSLDSV